MNYLSQALRSAPVLILLSMIFILIEFMIPQAFTFSFGRVFNAKDPFTLSFMVVFTLIFIFFVPLLLNQLFFKEPLENYGLYLPREKIKALLLILIALVVLSPGSYLIAQQPSMQIFYSLKEQGLASIIYDVLLAFPLYYFAEEFFFRGFLFLPLSRKIGWHSYWITELIFMWAHIGKPPFEVFYSFPAGLVLNYLTVKTKSFYPSMITHYLLGMGMTLYVTFL